MHGIKNPDLGQMPKTATQVSKKASGKVFVYLLFKPNNKKNTNVMDDFKVCDLCDFQGLVSERPAVVKQGKQGPDLPGSLEAPSAKRLKSQFRCSKCGFITDDSTQFQQHIPQHKSDENTPQCLHCGLCFTSVLSLNRHLFIVHKVKDKGGEGTGDRREKEVEVRGKEEDNQTVRSAETDEVNNSLPELHETEPSRAGEPGNLHFDKTTDCNLKLSAHTPTVSLR